MKIKAILPALAVLALSLSCKSPDSGAESASFGQKFDTAGSVSVNEMLDRISGPEGAQIKVLGEVSDVCQAEGCWLKLRREGGEPVLIRMKEHTFTVPKDIAGKTVIVQGFAHYDTTDVATLRDYAKDEGKSETEIAAITEPEIAPVVEADGITIR